MTSVPLLVLTITIQTCRPRNIVRLVYFQPARMRSGVADRSKPCEYLYA